MSIISILLGLYVSMGSQVPYFLPVDMYRDFTSSLLPEPDANELLVKEIRLNDTSLYVWLAQTNGQRGRGLSGVSLETLQAQAIDGMLFVFPQASEQGFWMNDMRFDLDFVWIANGEVVKIDEGIPAPVNNEGQIAELSSEPFAVDHVLEVPTGMVMSLGIEIGDILTK